MTTEMDKWSFDFALRMVEDNILRNRDTPQRLISGIALSSARPNANGDAFNVRGALTPEMPFPLLLDHDFLQPIGRVISLDERGTQLGITCELANSDRMRWAEEAWGLIVAQKVSAISIGAKAIGPAFGRTYDRWLLWECSVARVGADPGAKIEKCWTRENVVYLDGRPQENVHFNWRNFRVHR